MVEGGGGTAFPVIFFDGEREINIGNVKIHPMLDYKTFQLMLAQRIGISPNQISIYLVDRKDSKASHSPGERRKIPITGKVNFALICREKSCCFLVVLKRSRKARTRKLKPNDLDFSDYLTENDFSPTPAILPENVILLRRDQPPPPAVEASLNNPRVSGFPMPFYDLIAPDDFASLNERLQNLKIQRENYAMAMAQSNPNLNPSLFPRIEEAYSKTTTKKSIEKIVCEECTEWQKIGQTAPFHHCPNDEVVVAFRTCAGPIGRPTKPLP